jgi:exopolyphosphatase/pppGpp-phosphohydrolase
MQPAWNDTVAAIDCGTNSTRLLVATGAGLSVSRLMRITRLGQGVDGPHELAPEAIDVLTREAGDRWCEVLSGESAAARAHRSGMPDGREDVIVLGALILREAVAWLAFDRCVVSETHILDGLVVSLLV